MKAARAALVALALAVTGSAAADDRVSWDLARDYLANPASNPVVFGEGEWQLLRSEGSAGALTPLPTWTTHYGTVEGIVGWSGTESCNIHGCFPTVAVNTTGAGQLIPYSDLVIPAGAVWVHPANPDAAGDGNAAVAWRSPFSGWVSVTIQLAKVHYGPVSWGVDLSGQVLLPPTMLYYGDTGVFAQTLEVHEGDLITLRVGAGDGSYGADSSLLSFTVNHVAKP